MAKSKNLPPVAIAIVDKTEITLPDNKVTIDATKSYDPIKSGKVMRAEFYSDGGTVVNPIINDPNPFITDVIFPSVTQQTKYKVGVNVFDKANIKSTTPAEFTITVNPLPIPKNRPIDFGVKVVLATNAEQITVAKKLGVTMLRTSVEMYQYSGTAKFIDDIFDAGFVGCININWLPAGQTRKFCSGADLVTYETNLRRFYDKYCPKGGVHKVKYVFCENEPTHDAYYNDVIQNYIPVLEIFARVSNEYGVKCGCGGVFIEFINAYLAGGVPTGNNQYQNYVDNMWLIERMKTIPLTHANAHFALKNTFVDGNISVALKWLNKDVNRPIGTNEFHSAGATPKQLQQALQEFVDGGADFIQIWGGGGGTPADAVNDGTDLTAYGIAMRDFISDYNKGV